MFRNMVKFSRWVVVSTSSNPQAGGPNFVGCPRLLIQDIRSYPPYWRPFLHPEPEDAPCRGDTNPLITALRQLYFINVSRVSHWRTLTTLPSYLLPNPHKQGWTSNRTSTPSDFRSRCHVTPSLSLRRKNKLFERSPSVRVCWLLRSANEKPTYQAYGARAA